MGERIETRLAIVGAGPGGYPAAFLAADLGLETTIIDPAPNPGGVCLYRGCIPSKAMLNIAHLAEMAREAAHLGVTLGEPEFDLERIRAWKREVVERLTGNLGQIVQRKKIRHLRGRARFLDSHRLAVTPATADGAPADGGGGHGASGRRHDGGGGRSGDGEPTGETEVAFEQAIIASGSLPVRLPGLDHSSDRVMDAKTALELPDVPGSLLVIGGGYIGLELGSFYAALGSKVTVVEMMPSILPGVDRDLVSVLKRRLDGRLAEILTRTRVQDAKVQKNGVQVTLVGKDGEPVGRRFDRVLVAVGRRPNARDLGLETTKIEVDERGFIKVDEHRRTAEPHILAVGDVAGEPMLAHKATAEGKIAAENAAGLDTVYDARAVPAVVYTDPEVAWCGLTENQAREGGTKIKTAKIPWRSSGRALTLGRDDGMTKLLVDPGSERLLGVGLVGPGAGELIAEAVLAVELGASASDLRLMQHPHPTLSETLGEAAEMLFDPKLVRERPR